jgi:hypothetical protein
MTLGKHPSGVNEFDVHELRIGNAPAWTWEKPAMTQHAFSFRYDYSIHGADGLVLESERSCVVVATDMVSAMELLQQREGGQVVFLEAEAVGPVKYIQHEQA